jgi:hypothetical protein
MVDEVCEFVTQETCNPKKYDDLAYNFVAKELAEATSKMNLT